MPLSASLPFASVLLAAANTATPTVVAADGILCDLTRTLVGSQAKVICLIKPGTDPHTLALRPADRQNLAKAKVVLLNGYNLTPALNKIKTPGTVVKVGNIAVPNNPKKDPHIWHDPANVIAMANTVASRLKPFFDANGDAQIDQRRAKADRVLASLGSWIGQQVATVPEKQRVLVTGHRTFDFFDRRYGIRELPVLDDYTTGGTLRPSSLSAISKSIKASGSKAIFPESLPPSKTMRRISRSSGVPSAKQVLFGDGQAPGKSLVQTATSNICIFVKTQGGSCNEAAAGRLQNQWASIK
ncbi:MAG: zinc ABC transporter substrate-binding protein [Planctomycetaceae bacterium]|nr:zinc ABC transporter substrate-binding protein [Planctomycetaceae bacterium]